MASIHAVRQLKVISVLSFFVIAIFVALYFALIYTPPSCYDGEQNQREEGVDCGGPCMTPCELEPAENLIVGWEHFSKKQGRYYDLAAKITNRNNTFGSPKIPYEFLVKNSAQETVQTVEGETFIGPGQTRYVIASRVEMPEGFQSVHFRALDEKVLWQKVPFRVDVDDFTVYAKDLRRVLTGEYFAEATGIVHNRTSYDFANVDVDAALYNMQNNTVISVGRTILRDLRSGEEREFKVVWPERFDIERAGFIDVLPRTNILENTNYLRDIKK